MGDPLDGEGKVDQRARGGREKTKNAKHEGGHCPELHVKFSRPEQWVRPNPVECHLLAKLPTVTAPFAFSPRTTLTARICALERERKAKVQGLTCEGLGW